MAAAAGEGCWASTRATLRSTRDRLQGLRTTVIRNGEVGVGAEGAVCSMTPLRLQPNLGDHTPPAAEARGRWSRHLQGTLAAVAFAAVLLAVVKSGAVKTALTTIITTALGMAG